MINDNQKIKKNLQLINNRTLEHILMILPFNVNVHVLKLKRCNVYVDAYNILNM